MKGQESLQRTRSRSKSHHLLDDDDKSIHSHLSTSDNTTNTEGDESRSTFTENLTLYSQSWQHPDDEMTLGDENLSDDEEIDNDEDDDEFKHFTSWTNHLNLKCMDAKTIINNYHGDGKDEKSMADAVGNLGYHAERVFPLHCLRHPEWKNEAKEKGAQISHLFLVPVYERSPEQVSVLCTWLMSVWPVAAGMGFVRASQMLKCLKYCFYGENDDIVTQGEVGDAFYVIIQGIADVIVAGVGSVASLGVGRSFGETALKNEGDVRTATVRAMSQVECVSLSKKDYDRFIKDLQSQEQRENFNVVRLCPFFSSW